MPLKEPLLLAAVTVLLFAGFLMAYAIEQLYLRYPTKNIRGLPGNLPPPTPKPPNSQGGNSEYHNPH
jgi:hypothetical protein